MSTTLAPALFALAACAPGRSAPGHAVLSNVVPVPAARSALFNLEPGSLGPILPSTHATQVALEAVLGGRYRVERIDNHGFELHVFLGKELLFYVIPNDDGTLFNVHVVSSKIAITEHPQWVIGSPFTDEAPLTSCECWGRHPVCFHTGDHVAVAFEVDCDRLGTPEERHVLHGVPIQRAVWNPKPFGGGDAGDGHSTSPPPSLSKIFEGDPP